MSCAERRAAIGGFTLIELLIAISLGMVIAYGAFAALRLAAGAAAEARRLGDENALLRAGMIRAHDELDWWTMLDDPEDAAHQPLRAHVGAKGLAFTALRDSAGASSLTGPDPELRRGWDAGDPWSVHDPRTWYRGNPSEQDISDLRFGRYGAFANAESDNPALAPIALGGAPVGYQVGHVAHSWLFAQMRMLLDSLGYYAYSEYLPANSLYVYYRGYDATPQPDLGGNPMTALGGLPMELVKPGIARFASNDGYSGYPRGLYLLTFLASFALPNADSPAGSLPGISRTYYTTGYGLTWAGPAEYQRLIADTQTARPLMTVAPAHWARVDVSIQRFIRFARYTQVARVRWTSPITGARRELNFTGLATTLRGARQQRRPDSGWARWNDDGSANDATLDTH